MAKMTADEAADNYAQNQESIEKHNYLKKKEAEKHSTDMSDYKKPAEKGWWARQKEKAETKKEQNRELDKIYEENKYEAWKKGAKEQAYADVYKKTHPEKSDGKTSKFNMLADTFLGSGGGSSRSGGPMDLFGSSGQQAPRRHVTSKPTVKYVKVGKHYVKVSTPGRKHYTKPQSSGGPMDLFSDTGSSRSGGPMDLFGSSGPRRKGRRGPSPEDLFR